VVSSYKSLSQVEQAFRTLKSPDLEVRPIYHRKDERIRAHVLLCMLAYYVVWHMQRALAPLLFSGWLANNSRAAARASALTHRAAGALWIGALCHISIYVPAILKPE
jgi:hypothetical protein